MICAVRIILWSLINFWSKGDQHKARPIMVFTQISGWIEKFVVLVRLVCCYSETGIKELMQKVLFCLTKLFCCVTGPSLFSLLFIHGVRPLFPTFDRNRPHCLPSFISFVLYQENYSCNKKMYGITDWSSLITVRLSKSSACHDSFTLLFPSFIPSSTFWTKTEEWILSPPLSPFLSPSSPHSSFFYSSPLYPAPISLSGLVLVLWNKIVSEVHLKKGVLSRFCSLANHSNIHPFVALFIHWTIYSFVDLELFMTWDSNWTEHQDIVCKQSNIQSPGSSSSWHNFWLEDVNSWEAKITKTQQEWTSRHLNKDSGGNGVCLRRKWRHWSSSEKRERERERRWERFNSVSLTLVPSLLKEELLVIAKRDFFVIRRSKGKERQRERSKLNTIVLLIICGGNGKKYIHYHHRPYWNLMETSYTIFLPDPPAIFFLNSIQKLVESMWNSFRARKIISRIISTQIKTHKSTSSDTLQHSTGPIYWSTSFSRFLLPPFPLLVRLLKLAKMKAHHFWYKLVTVSSTH